MTSELKSKGATITHAGTVKFDNLNGYQVGHGTGNWKVSPIAWPGFKPGQEPPVGQVLITFDKPIAGPYTVLVTAERSMDAPMLSANYGDKKPESFVVVIFNPVATLSYQTVRNSHFSFMVLQ